MTEQHLITPPDDLVKKWAVEYWGHPKRLVSENEKHIAAQAARWGADQQLKLDAEQIAQAYQAGADQELEACCEWVAHILDMPGSAICLREDRRPKPPSLKEQALDALNEMDEPLGVVTARRASIIRRALEQLDD